MDGNPNTGVPVYDSYDFGGSTPWGLYGGTSLATPMYAGIIAIADQGRVLNGLSTLDGPSQTLPKLYSISASDMHDVTTGNNFYAAGVGYDLVTGRGSPIINLLANDLASSSPAIGGFTVNPTTVPFGGTPITLSATNVTETGGTITAVDFYRESNGTTGLQIGSDTLVGVGTPSGTTWTLANVSTTGLSAGSYTFYAIAASSAGNSSPSSATLTVVVPTIGGFTVNPTTAPVDTPRTLSATNVTEPGETITAVNFYLESNGTTGLQIGSDTLVGAGTQSGTTWTLSNLSTAGLAVGSYTFYAVAADSIGNSSSAASASFTVDSPTIGTFTVSPSAITLATPITLSATNVTEAGGTIAAVNFYLESNETAGLQIGSDTLVGAGTQNGTTWTLSNASTASLPVGNYTFYAVAADSIGNSSSVSSAGLTISDGFVGELLGWNVNGQTNYGTQDLAAATVAPGVTNSLGLTRGSGVSTSGSAASNAWGGRNWASSSSSGISGNEFASFGLTVGTGDVVSLSSIDMNYRRGSTGPANGLWQYQFNGGNWTTIADISDGFASSSASGAAISPIDLSGVSALQNPGAGDVVNIRVVPYGTSSSLAAWYVYDLAGDDLILDGSVTAAQIATTTTISANTPNPSTAGQPIAFNVAVSGGVPDGETVTLDDASNANVVVGTGTLTSGSASINVSNLAVGTHDIFAVYGGDSTFASSQSSTVAQTVNPISTTTTLVDNGPDLSTSSQSVSFLVTVSPTVPDGETVTLEDASNSNVEVGTGTLAGGSASIDVSNLSVGTHDIFAVYGGDSTYSASQSNTVVQIVNFATTTTVGIDQAGPYTTSSSLTFTATVTGNPSVGTVTFYVGSDPIGSPVNVVDGTADSAPGQTFPAGTNTVNAVYSGGAGFAGSQGTNTFQVSAPQPSVTNVVINQDIAALYADQTVPGGIRGRWWKTSSTLSANR